jgi:VWFA-related protein
MISGRRCVAASLVPVVLFVLIFPGVGVAGAAGSAGVAAGTGTLTGPAGTDAVVGAPGTADEPFAEAIDVAVVNLEIVVRDKAGKLVGGLTRDDFTLYVDGRTTAISNFAATDPGAGGAPAGGSPAGGPTPQAAAGHPEGVPAAATDEPKREPLKLVVYVDDANVRPADRNRLLKQLRGFLDQRLAAGDRVMLVTYNHGLHIRHRFQDDLQALAPELAALTKESALGIQEEVALRQMLQQIHELGCGQFGQAAAVARQHVDAVYGDVVSTYAALHHLVESLGGVAGRKALIYVGDGVANQVGTDVFGVLQEMCPDDGKTLVLERKSAIAPMQAVIAAANANLVTLYTLETAGLRSYTSAEDDQPLMSLSVSRDTDIDRQDSLTNLARETGGRAALNGNDLRRDIEEIGADLGGGYSLGFTPAQAGDGRLHTLKVELQRPGLRAAYRASYRDRSAQERLEGETAAALLYGQLDNPLGASVRLTGAVPAEHGRLLVPLQLRVPFSKLAWLPQADGRQGRLSLVVGSLDAKGAMSPLRHLREV